ncbi:hypothetical protein [Deinococcus budaensis]|uniref:Chromosome segregation ATPase n=1 Tax=Deinococcus budaensis TaxID=1665626 RepID=A0A7W8LRD7_9DEIO|nr:hypothetical protein [Deinococcus budaensis]MBB5235522.1 chromosome segregation ATPase [Deinococcus budaensis]
MTTSYLDDAWIQEEQRQFEHLKAQLLASARLLEQATTAVPELTRQLEQLTRREQEVRGALTRQSREQQEALGARATGLVAEIGARAQEGRAALEAHLQELIDNLDRANQAGSLLSLQRDVQSLLEEVARLETGLVEMRGEAVTGQARWAGERQVLERRVEDLSRDLAALRDQTGAHPETWQRELGTGLAPVRTQLEHLGAALAAVQGAQQAQEARLGDEAGRLHERQGEAEGQLQHLLGAVGELRGELDASGRGLEQARQELAALERARQRHEASHENLARRASVLEGLAQSLPGEWRADFDRQAEALQALRGAIDAVTGRVQEQARQSTAATARLGELEQSFDKRLEALERKMRGLVEAGISRIRDEQEAQSGQLRQNLTAASAEQREHLTAVERALREDLRAAGTRAGTLETRLQAQQDALAELDRRSQADGSRLTRFLAWFSAAGTVARMRGKPE